MLKKIFRSQKTGQAAFLLMIASLLSYSAGLFRDRIIANVFGVGPLVDTYNTAFIIPDILFNTFIAGALSVAFVPVFASYLKIDKKEAYTIANTVITISSIVLAILAFIFYFLVPYLIPAIFHTATLEEQNLIITMTRILLLSPLFFAISNALGSILITHKHFLAYALSGFLYNTGIILGILMFHEQIGIFSAALGAIIGAFFHLMIRLLDVLTTKYRFKTQLSLKHKGVIKIFKLMIPKTIGLLSWQINLIVYAVVGFTLVEGSFTAFHFSRNLQSFPVSLFGISFATAVFPFLSDHVHNKDQRRFSDDFQISLEKILFFVVPAALGMLLLHREIIQIILLGGAFDQAALELTAPVFFFFILSIPIEACIHLFARGYFSHKNTLTPMTFRLIGAAFNIFIVYLVSSTIGAKSFSIAFLVGSSTQLFLLIIFFRKHLTQFDIKHFVIKILKISLATIIMAAAVYFIPLFISTSFFTLQLIRVIIGASLYLLITYLLRCRELQFFKTVLIKLFNK